MKTMFFACALLCGIASATEAPPELCRLAALSAAEQFDKNNVQASAWLQPLVNEQIEFLESILKQIGEPQWKDAANYVRTRNSILNDRYFSDETRRYDLRMHEGSLDMTRGAILRLIRNQEASLFQQLGGRKFARQICPESSRATRPLPEGFGSAALIDRFVTVCRVARTGESIVPSLERRFAVVSQDGEPSVIARTFVRGPLGDAALESRINLVTRQIEGRDVHSALRMVYGESAQAALLGPERSTELFYERAGIGLACDSEPLSEAPEIANLCRLAEERAVVELRSKQTHPLVKTGEHDARMQAALLRALFVRLSAQERRDLKRYNVAMSEASGRGPEAMERIESFYAPLHERLTQLLSRQSVFEGFTPTISTFAAQECPTPRSAALTASRISGRGDWRDTLRTYFPQYVRSCRIAGPDEDKHTLPLLQRTAGIEMKAGSVIAWATTFRQVVPGADGAPTGMILMETQWDLLRNQVKGAHFADALKLSSLQGLIAAARTTDRAVDDYLRDHGVLDLCRPDVNFLDNTPDPRN